MLSLQNGYSTKAGGDYAKEARREYKNEAAWEFGMFRYHITWSISKAVITFSNACQSRNALQKKKNIELHTSPVISEPKKFIPSFKSDKGILGERIR